MTTGHIQKKDVDRKVRKMNKTHIKLKKIIVNTKNLSEKKIPVFKKEFVEQKNKK